MSLSFRLGGIPVRILPSFFLTTVIINFGLAESAPHKLIVWAAIVLVSVLVHELGHALAGLAFGLKPRIDLHGFGGTTSWAGTQDISSAKRIVISLAGPGMGFVAGGLTALYLGLFGPGFAYAARAVLGVFGLALPVSESSIADFTYVSLLFVNVGWGVLNLLPMLPLDGGNVMKHTIDMATAGRGERLARVVSLVVALIATPVALVACRRGARSSRPPSSPPIGEDCAT